MKFLIFCFIFLVACANHTSPTPTPNISNTMKEIVIPSSTFTPSPIATLPPTATAIPTLTASLPPTPSSTYTPTPEPVLPTASLLFLHENNLQQWFPKTGEVKTLAENISGNPTYSEEVILFFREDESAHEKTLVAFHIPSQSEFELLRIPATIFFQDISISPNSRWLTYITGESGESDDSVTLTVHEMINDNEQVLVSEPVFVTTLGHEWKWPYDQMMWATNDTLSWSDQNGIWIADLTSNPIESAITIPRSTNTFEHPSGEIANTHYIPYEWSPDGNYLVAIEYIYEGGPFVVIEKGGNRSFQIPEAQYGYVSDKIIWLDNEKFIHFDIRGAANVWHIQSGTGELISLESAIDLSVNGEFANFSSESSHIQFSRSAASETPYAALYNLDINTGNLTQISQDYSHFQRPGLDRWTPVSTIWSPDRQFALITIEIEDNENDGIKQVVILDFLDGKTTLDVTHLFDSDTCCWHWYEEE